MASKCNCIGKDEDQTQCNPSIPVRAVNCKLIDVPSTSLTSEQMHDKGVNPERKTNKWSIPINVHFSSSMIKLSWPSRREKDFDVQNIVNFENFGSFVDCSTSKRRKGHKMSSYS